jgi:hypothetical protein
MWKDPEVARQKIKEHDQRLEVRLRRSELRRKRYHSDPVYRAEVIEKAKKWNREHKRK